MGRISPEIITMEKITDKASLEISRAEQLKAGIPGSRLIAFENSGHSLFLEETLKFNEELIKFAKSTRR